MHRLGLMFLSTTSALVMIAESTSAASFTPLGNRVIANGVSADGSTVVGYVNQRGGPPYEAFAWSQSSGLRLLVDFPGGDESSVANGVSAYGSVVVGFGSPDPAGTGVGAEEAFVWNDSTGLVGIGDLPGDPIRSSAQAVSADGKVIVGYGRLGNLDEAFIWDSTRGMRGLGDLPGGGESFGEPHSFALDVSADGTVVVGQGATDLGFQAFIWDEANGIRGLGGIPGVSVPDSTANAISADGTKVVGHARSAVSGREAFIWDATNGMRGLGVLGNVRTSISTAKGVSADGKVIVGSNQAVGVGLRAVIWKDSSGIQELKVFLTSMGVDLTGWQLESANDISADGMTIVGEGRNPSGEIEGWIAVIPEPSTALLTLLGLVGLGWRRYESPARTRS